ncbi:hypothetical protein KY290_037010 [Solanum tuberosum]|uniref:Integrase core domain containing protein n=1 Tax=Solanum tuberosum TaxID=4113 RepID=A0ABQ7TY41_SOLTU|nr:hypothetical protein KY289_036500 [Solanum tuberosum]KAH0738305.1 hypothetical protein KY290_037010 [Solanum tuberosum]
MATKHGDMKCAGLPKKFLKGEYQLFFEFVNKVLVPRTEKRIMASTANLFLMEQLDELKVVSLPGIMLEHMHRVMTWINSKHGIPYGYLLNHVFEHFGLPLGMGVSSILKQMFSPTTILECECAEGKIKAKSHVSDLLEQQESLNHELNNFTVTLSAKDGPGTSTTDKEEVE